MLMRPIGNAGTERVGRLFEIRVRITLLVDNETRDLFLVDQFDPLILLAASRCSTCTDIFTTPGAYCSDLPPLHTESVQRSNYRIYPTIGKSQVVSPAPLIVDKDQQSKNKMRIRFEQRS